MTDEKLLDAAAQSLECVSGYAIIRFSNGRQQSIGTGDTLRLSLDPHGQAIVELFEVQDPTVKEALSRGAIAVLRLREVRRLLEEVLDDLVEEESDS